MRTGRFRLDDEGAYYHLITRAVGTSAARPFGDSEKNKLVELLHELDEFYTVEVLAYSMMSNHVHICVYAPSELPRSEDAAARFNAYHKVLAAHRERVTGQRMPAQSIRQDSYRIEQVQRRLRDISYFMKYLQQRFTQWYNKRLSRRGAVWADRFKNVLLEGEGGNSAVWNCVKYIELNALRAGLVEEPADYRYCSWGVWHGRSKHPFAGNFFRHMRIVLGEAMAKLTDKQLQRELQAQLVRTIVAEQEAPMEDVIAAYKEAQKGEPLFLRLDRRVRYWTDGAVIGSREFVQRVSDGRFGKGKRRRFTQGQVSDGESLFILRRLRE
jgi:REP element-mobilizing transposase RayT